MNWKSYVVDLSSYESSFVMEVSKWLGKQEFTELSNSSHPQIILFAAKWCGFCARFLEAARGFKAPSDAELFLVDVDDPDESLWDIYKLKLVPTLVIFRSGRQLFRKDGAPGIGLLLSDLVEALNAQSSNLKPV
jgi:thioredoxin